MSLRIGLKRGNLLLGNDNFPGHNTGQLILQPIGGVRKLMHKEFARGNIAECDARAIFLNVHCHDIAGLVLIEHIGFDDGTRRNDARYGSFNQSL